MSRAICLIVGTVAMFVGFGCFVAIGLPVFHWNEGDWPWGKSHHVGSDKWALCFVYGAVTIIVCGSMSMMAFYVGCALMGRL